MPVAFDGAHLELVVGAVGEAGEGVRQRRAGAADAGPGTEVAGAFLLLVLPLGQRAAAGDRGGEGQLAAAGAGGGDRLARLGGLGEEVSLASTVSQLESL